MATCQNCNHKWNWRTTFKQLLTFRNVLECHTVTNNSISLQNPKSDYQSTHLHPLLFGLFSHDLTFPFHPLLLRSLFSS